MTFDEFVAKLDKNNWYYDDVAGGFQCDIASGEYVLERKGRDLPEVVERLKALHLFPVVDKKLGLVLGCKSHSVPRQELFRYFYYAGGSDRPYVDPDESADRYISEGHAGSSQKCARALSWRASR